MDANANQADETNGQASQIWTKTVYGWQQKGFRAMREKQSCLQKVKRIKCPKGNKQTCDLGCARYPRQNKARDEQAAESLLRIGDLMPPARLSDDDSARRRYSFHALPIA